MPTVLRINGYVTPKQIKATRLTFTEDALEVQLEDGRNISLPLEWFPRLRDATPEARANWRFIGGGLGIHWADLDEDLSVAKFLEP